MTTTKRTFFAMAALLASTGAALAQRIPASEAVSGMEATWNGLTSYSCRMAVWSKNGRDEKRQEFRFDFKKPHMIRLKVLADPNKGADVVYDAGGHIHAAKRVLGIRVKKSMRASEPDFHSARGVGFWEADLGTQISTIKDLMSSHNAVATAEKSHDGGESVVTLALRWRGEDARLKNGEHSYVREYRLDPKTYFPLLRTTTEDGTKVEEVTISEINLKTDFPDDHFRL